MLAGCFSVLSIAGRGGLAMEAITMICGPSFI